MKKKIYIACAVITVVCIAIIAYCMGKSAGSKAQAPASAPAPAAEVAQSGEVKEEPAPAESTEAEDVEEEATESAPVEDAKAEGASDTQAYDLEYWTEGSKVAQSIKDYVAEVCDESSSSFVPQEDRIACFDMDGTFIGELYPTYFDTCMFVYRVLEDEEYEGDAEMKEFAQMVRDAMNDGTVGEVDMQDLARHFAKCYSGMTMDEFADYVVDFKTHEPEGFDNLKYETSFYKPMISVIRYLKANDFRVYVVSGTERMTVRALLEDELGDVVPPECIIGSDFTLAASGQEDAAGIDYTFAASDKVVMGDDLIVKNLKMNKVTAIQRELGKDPILVFGNSTGDFAMAQMALNNNKYEGRAYMLLCDDTERDYGKPEKAASFKEKCEAAGYIPVSMKDDFATIYGDDVKLNPAKRPGATEETPDNVIEFPQNEQTEEKKAS